MYYRYSKSGMRIPVDLDGIYEGQSLMLIGGAPSLQNEDLDKLNQSGITVMSMNNTPSVLPCTDLWVGCDRPKCYSPRILLDPKIMKFQLIAKRNMTFQFNGNDYELTDCPNIYFFGTHTRFTVNTLLKKDRDFVWWKNTFWVALQIAHRLGFKKVYLAGCAFQIDKKAYSYDFKLNEYQTNYNQRLYDYTVTMMKQAKQHFDEQGFEIISVTPDSKLNGTYPFMQFDKAIEEMLKNYPVEYDINKCIHSSQHSNNKG